MDSITLPTYILLEEAAVGYNVPPAVLRSAVASGSIRAVEIDGKIAVADEDAAIVAAQMKAESTGDELISISQASRKLDIPISVIWRWQDYGWLPVIATGPRRAKLVSWERAKALGRLYREHSQRGSRLIPRGKEISEFTSLL